MMAAGTGQSDRLGWLETMIDHIPDYIYAKDVEGRFLIANRATVVDNGLASVQDLIGKTDFDLHPHDMALAITAVEKKVIESGQPIFGLEQKALVDKGFDRWLMTSMVPLRDSGDRIVGIVGVSRDISEIKRAEGLHVGQARLLEMIAMGAPLQEIFSALILFIEGQMSGIDCSILLLSQDRKHLLIGAAPSMDPAYSRLIDGILIGPKVGSCGTAAYRGETVIVSDVMNDPLWEDFRDLVEPFGYRSCWSTPILSYQGEVLGTFALYSRTVGTLTEKLALPSKPLSEIIGEMMTEAAPFLFQSMQNR